MTYLSYIPWVELRRGRPRQQDGPVTRHRDVMSVFPELPLNARKAASILFRVENYGSTGPHMLVRSAVQPTHLPRGAQVKKENLPVLVPGAAVHFRIAVNAVRRNKTGGVTPVSVDDSDDSKPSLTPWLQEKLDPGFEEIHVIHHLREVVSGSQIPRKPHTVQIDYVDGVALVRDPETVRDYQLNGVGRARAYGCGLLTLRRF